MRLVHVVGTRPNLVKMAPVIGGAARALSRLAHGDRPHGPALRPADVRDLPRGARRARARPPAGGRIGKPRGADRAGAGATRAGAAGRAPRPGDRARGRQLDPRRGAVRGEAGNRGRPPGVRPAELRPHDARGDEPDRRRPARVAVLPALRRGGGEPARRGGGGVAAEVRRQHDDRHPGGAHRPDPRAPRGRRARARARRATCW